MFQKNDLPFLVYVPWDRHVQMTTRAVKVENRAIKLKAQEEWEYPIQRVYSSRSQPRDALTGAIQVDIIYNEGSINEACIRWSIRVLIDELNRKIPLMGVKTLVKDWKKTAMIWPKKKRLCLCCWRDTVQGSVLCKTCTIKFGDIIDSI